MAPTAARNYGVIKIPGTFVPSTEYFVSYTAGYASQIPHALEMACIQLVKFKYDQSKQSSGNMRKETIGNVYSYEKFALSDLQDGLPPDLMAELNLFRRVEF